MHLFQQFPLSLGANTRSPVARAISDLDEAIAELRQAEHDFGGLRDETIIACENAQRLLREVMIFRPNSDSGGPVRTDASQKPTDAKASDTV